VSRAASVTQDLRFVQDETGSHALADDMICPRITGLGAELDDLGPVMEASHDSWFLGLQGGLR